MPILFGTDIAAAIRQATRGLLESFTLNSKLHRPRVNADRSGSAQWAAGAPLLHSAPHDCEGILEGKRKTLNGRATGETQITAFIIAGSLPAGIVPKTGDTLTARGREHTITSVSQDPAEATFELFLG